MTPTLAEVKSWAGEAGEILLKNFRQRHQIHHKGRFDLVTEADTASEALIIKKIRTHFPDHEIITEESGHLPGAGGTWYIDPLDGTINYAHGMPVFAVSMAYSEAGQMRLAVVYDPIRGEFFSAERGQGAYLNQERIQVSEVTHLTDSLLVTGFPYNAWDSPLNNLDNYGRFARLTQGVRRLGSAALDLCYVAAGRLDGYWEIEIKSWDIAAGTLIVEEAGGLVTDMHGNRDYFHPPYSIIAAPAALHAEMLEVIQE
jgi:myo-inositol-1(or 4)-monophosphatase